MYFKGILNISVYCSWSVNDTNLGHSRHEAEIKVYVSYILRGRVESFAIFWLVLVCCAYITWPKQCKPLQVTKVVSSIVVVSALTGCALLCSVCDLKVAQMNVQRSSIREFMQYKFEQSHNAAKVTIFTNSSAQVGYDTKSIFKRSSTGLNSEFSFS